MKISIGTVILAGGDGVDEQPYDLSINNTRSTQIVSTIRNETIRGFDRGNQRTTLEFKVAKRHASPEAAQAYTIQHAASLKDLSSELIITDELSQETYTLNDAVINEIQSSYEEVVSFNFYKIVGGNFKKN